MGNWDVELNPNKDGVKIELFIKQDVVNLIDELNAISFYEANEHSRECYYDIRNAVIAMQPVASCSDAISRQGLLDTIDRFCDLGKRQLKEIVRDLPPVTPKQRTGWIPVIYRPATDEEKKDYAERTGYDEEDIDTILNCQLPEDGETVLITDRLGNVEVDTFINDGDGCYFECNCDMEDVRAWMPLPKPYEPQESEKQA